MSIIQNSRAKMRLLHWLAVLAWAGIIFLFSAQPDLSTGLGNWDLVLRKAAHMCEFGILALLLWLALAGEGLPRMRAMVTGGLLAVLYAASDEFHQVFVQGRHGTPVDVAIDAAGILIAIVVAQRIVRRRQVAA